MDLFSLVAKLTLDSKEFDSALKEAESEASSFESPESDPLELDNEDFMDNIEEAQDASDSFESPESSPLELDNGGFMDAVGESEEAGINLKDALGQVFTGIKSALDDSGVSIGMAAVGVALTGVINLAKQGVELVTETADGIDKGSRALGISTQKYQEWNHALQQSGASVNDLRIGIRQMNKHLHDTEDEDITDAFNKLGISATDANGQLKTTEKLIEESLIALAGFTGSTDERGVLVEKLFGRSGNNLNALLDSGVDGVKDLLGEANDLGIVLSNEEIDNAVAYGDAVSNLNTELDSIKMAFVQDIIPVLKTGVEWLTELLTLFNPRLRETSISDTFKEIDGQLEKDEKLIESQATKAEVLAKKLLDMGDVSQQSADKQAVWRGVAEELIETVPELADEIDLETMSIKGGSEALKENIEKWKELAREKAISSAIEKKEQALADKNEALIEKRVDAITKEAEAQAAYNSSVQKFSDKMKQLGLGELDMNGDINKQISDVMTKLADGGDQYETEQAALGATLKEYGEAQTELAKAQKAVADSEEELKKAGEELQRWKESAALMFDSTTEKADATTASVNALSDALSKLNLPFFSVWGGGKSHAIGSAYIPFDNYPALLHRGEKVLTAAEARQHGDEYLSGADIGREIREAMGRVNVMMSGEKVGNLTTKRVERNIRADNYSKLRAMGG